MKGFACFVRSCRPSGNFLTTGWCFSFSDRKKTTTKNPKLQTRTFHSDRTKQTGTGARKGHIPPPPPPRFTNEKPQQAHSPLPISITLDIYTIVWTWPWRLGNQKRKAKSFIFARGNAPSLLPFHWHLGSLDMSSVTSWHSLQCEHATVGAWVNDGWKRKEEKRTSAHPGTSTACFCFPSASRWVWVNLSEGRNLHKQYGGENGGKTEGMW